MQPRLEVPDQTHSPEVDAFCVSGKSETKRPRPQTARQFRDNKTKARKTPSYLKGTESSKLKDTSLSSTSLSSTSLSLRCTSPLLHAAVVPNLSLPLTSACALITPIVSRCCWCSARPSHKLQRTGSRLLDKQQSKPASRSSARSARPQSAPLGGRTAGSSRRDRKLPLGVGAAKNKYLLAVVQLHEVGRSGHARCPWQNGQWLGGVDGWQQ